MGDLRVFTGRRITSTRVLRAARVEAAGVGEAAEKQDPHPNREKRPKPGESQPDDRGRTIRVGPVRIHGRRFRARPPDNPPEAIGSCLC